MSEEREYLEDKIKKETDNRSCNNCKHFCIEEIGLFGGWDTEQYNSCNNNVPISNLDIGTFYCSRYEAKGE